MYTLLLSFTAALASDTPKMTTPAADTVPSLALLEQWMVGRFDSAVQAGEDARYFDVSLSICPVRWSGGEHVVYVEQAMTAKLEAPYRQRLYVLSETDGGFRSQILELADPKAVVGLCADPSRFRPDTEARPLNGCAVQLDWNGDAFVGSTDGDSCKNTWGDAVYATSEVHVHANGVNSWDRGYDAAGEQVWGAEAGPYRFVRVATTP